jgi:hypothetical protein
MYSGAVSKGHQVQFIGGVGGGGRVELQKILKYRSGTQFPHVIGNRRQKLLHR